MFVGRGLDDRLGIDTQHDRDLDVLARIDRRLPLRRDEVEDVGDIGPPGNLVEATEPLDATVDVKLLGVLDLGLHDRPGLEDEGLR